MGVPAFYRWLSQRYPRIVKDVKEVECEVVDGEMVPVNTLDPNPNEEEFDHLYLDMNGIIHPCFHPEGRPAPTLESEVFECMFEYIDRIFAIVRPRKLLFMAIDGVAPRAKMNQQRSRRFRAAQENKEKMETEERIRKEFEQRGIKLASVDESEVMDSNVITPGTPFMHRLSAALQYYVHKRCNEDPGWRGINVVISDSNVPGEGEHKVVDFIRRQRGLDGWNPNTRHVLYGLDADLIMLALATHEPYFYILREVVVQTKENRRAADLQMQLFQMKEEENKQKSQRELLLEISRIDRKPYQLVHISVLREYLILDMGNTAVEPSFKVDPERLIDDFILLCFFCGNDFLPHMPTLEIREGALNLLISVYQHTMPKIGHLSKGEHINMRRMEVFVERVSMCEQAIFQKRAFISQKQKNRQLQQYEADQRRKREQESRERQAAAARAREDPGPKETNKSAADLLRERLMKKSVAGENGGTMPAAVKEEEGAPAAQKEEEPKVATEEQQENFKRQLSETMKRQGDHLKEVLFAEDKIRLGQDGWKFRYYEEKFHVAPGEQMQALRADVVRNYVEGLCWVMKYYYQGCPSWSWYFRYHYAPFASDLRSLHEIPVEFQLGEPFKPLDQLMAVLPPASSHCMPEKYKELMTDKSSVIADFYPETFPVDPNGKRYSWMHIALLPFIDEKRLLAAIRPLESTLTPEETRRNSLLSTLMVVHKSHPLSWPLLEAEAKEAEEGAKPKEASCLAIDAEKNNNINGRAILPGGSVGLCPKTIKSMYDTMEDVRNNKALCFAYSFPDEQVHVPRPLAGTELPERTLRDGDTPLAPEIWHEENWQRRGGHRGGGGGGYGQYGGGAGHFHQQQVLGQNAHQMIYGQGNTNLYICPISRDTTEADLGAAFGGFGEITSIRVLNQKSCAFVTYRESECAGRALMAMNGVTIKGSQVRVEWGKARTNQNQNQNQQRWGWGR